MTKIKWAKMWNGRFPICPYCGSTMARQMVMKGKQWVCLFGCGFVYSTEV